MYPIFEYLPKSIIDTGIKYIGQNMRIESYILYMYIYHSSIILTIMRLFVCGYVRKKKKKETFRVENIQNELSEVFILLFRFRLTHLFIYFFTFDLASVENNDFPYG